MAAVSFGYQAGDGTGTNVNIAAVEGRLYLTPYVNDTGGYVFVSSVDLLASTQARASGTWYAILYLLDHFTGKATELLAISDALSSIPLGTVTWTFTGWGGDIIIHPGQQVGVGLFFLNPPSSVTGQIRCDGATTSFLSSKRYVSAPGYGAPTNPFPPAAGWLSDMLPMRVHGVDTGTLPADDARLNQMVVENFGAGMVSDARLDQLLVEPFGGDNAYLRADMIAVESLVPIAEEAIVPTDIFPTLSGLSWTVHKAPTFNTQVRKSTSNRRTANSLTPYPVWNFTLEFDYLPNDPAAPNVSLGDTDLQYLMGFFMKQNGKALSWLFHDPTDYAVTAGRCITVDAGAIVGDGVSTEWYLCRTMGPFHEPVGARNESVALNVYANAVLVDPADYTYTAPNQIVFDVAPAAGVVITASFEFRFVCAFLDDIADFENFASKLWDLQELKFESIIQ